MRYLAIDYGTRRLGLAVSDPEGRMAFPYKTIEYRASKKLVREISEIIAQEEIEGLVMGLPLTLEAEETDLSAKVRKFAESLEKATGLRVHLVNEALTSFEAEQALKQAGVSAKKQKKIVDQQAAVIILQSYLESLNFA